jgi:hypothetical protein
MEGFFVLWSAGLRRRHSRVKLRVKVLHGLPRPGPSGPYVCPVRQPCLNVWRWRRVFAWAALTPPRAAKPGGGAGGGPRRRYRELVVAIVPSYLKKLTKSKEDLASLEEDIERYVMRDPYRVIESAEGKRRPKVRRLEITSDPANTEIPTIAAGIIYNLRSGPLLAHPAPARARRGPHREARRHAAHPVRALRRRVDLTRRSPSTASPCLSAW